MATTRKRKTKKVEEKVLPDLGPAPEVEVSKEIVPREPVIVKEKEPVIVKEKKPVEIKPKFSIGSIVYVSKDADADLNGFKLFPQYKKYTYTVEAYDADRDIYSLRKLNLLLKLKGDLIINPDERAHDSLNRKQF